MRNIIFGMSFLLGLITFIGQSNAYSMYSIVCDNFSLKEIIVARVGESPMQLPIGAQYLNLLFGNDFNSEDYNVYRVQSVYSDSGNVAEVNLKHKVNKTTLSFKLYGWTCGYGDR